MPKAKLKTHSGAKRRFKVSGGGKFLRMKEGRGLKRNRAKRVRNLYSKMIGVSHAGEGHLEKAFPYGLE